jgi:hypothetical protein
MPGRRSLVRTAALFSFAILAAIAPAEATRVRSLNIEEMSQRASRIFAGRCVDVRVERDVTLGLDVTLAKFEVTRSSKGEATPHVVLRMLGGGQGASIPGRPEFAVGEEVVLFLYGVSRHGLTSPVGMGQGAFKVLTDKQGRKVAVNAFENRALFDRLEPVTMERLGIQPAERTGAKPVSPQALLHMAEAFSR